MEELIMYAVGYAALLALGLQALRREGRKIDRGLFIVLIAWCAYMNIAGLLRWPTGSVAELNGWLFFPIGQWIFALLDGMV